MLPVDRGFARWDEPELLRDRGGEDARVAMFVRLQDQSPEGAGHTPRSAGSARRLPPLPNMICRTNAAAEGETSSDGPSDVGLCQRHRLRDAVAQRKLAGEGRRKSAARPVGMPVVVSGRGVGEMLAIAFIR